MNTKVKLLGLGILIILISGYFSALNTEISIYDKEKFTGIGKYFTIVIEQDEVRDYTVLDTDKFILWNKNERDKLKKRMKEKQFLIKAGSYGIHQGHKYEEVIDIFKFE